MENTSVSTEVVEMKSLLFFSLKIELKGISFLQERKLNKGMSQKSKLVKNF